LVCCTKKNLATLLEQDDGFLTSEPKKWRTVFSGLIKKVFPENSGTFCYQ
jgi:hypothetical protein